MKRVVLHYPILNAGGAEQSSLRLIKALCDRGWDVTLVLTTGGGVLEPEVDPRARIVRLRSRPSGHTFKMARGLWPRLRALPDLGLYLLIRLIGGVRMLPFLFRRYDAAAVLLMGTSSFFVRRFVRAPVKAIWIRSDLSGADPTGAIGRSLSRAARRIDHFICVSEVSRSSLIAKVPEADGKAVVVYNILDVQGMWERAAAAPPPYSKPAGGVPIVLTVCRLSERSKGLRRMVRVCKALAEAGVQFHWYVAGDGPDRGVIEHEIEVNGLSEQMTLLGHLANPFPAYQAADLVAMLSNYEGLCGAVNEARVFERAVIATQVSGIDEQLVDGINGLVVPQDEASIVAGMRQLLLDPALRAQLAAGGYPAALLDDAVKLDLLESLFLRQRASP